MNKENLGVYVHIPFCKRKCNYCDFSSYASCSESQQEEYVRRLIEEIKKQGQQADKYCVDTIFIGGGTPTCLEKSLMEKVVNTLYQTFSISEQLEFSMECNPGTVDFESLCFYQSLGINRLSIGLQSANDHELKLLGRIHTFDDFMRCYNWARTAGFSNINIDLMSGIPEQTLSSYQETCRKVIECKPEHISAYSLIIEEGTPFGEKYQNQPPMDEEVDRQLYHFTKKFLHEFGYERYEISNYSKPGKECRHNLKYWDLSPYLGLGLAAASYLDEVRIYNADNFESYQQGKVTKEVSSKKEQMEEYVFLGLRKCKGFSSKEFYKKFGIDVDIIYNGLCQRLMKQGLLTGTGEWISLTEWGMDVSNQVMSQFILDEE